MYIYIYINTDMTNCYIKCIYTYNTNQFQIWYNEKLALFVVYSTHNLN